MIITLSSSSIVDDMPTLISIDRYSNDGRLLQSINTHDMRIDIDTSDADMWLSTSNAVYYAKYRLIRRNIDKLRAYVEKHFRVFFFDEFVYPEHSCSGLSYKFPSGRSASDLKLTLLLENSNSQSYTAAALTCIAWKDNGRPLVGVLRLNLQGIGYRPTSDFTLFSILMHELTHILGFNRFYFTSYPIPPGTLAGQNIWLFSNKINNISVIDSLPVQPALVIESVTLQAIIHYGCQSIGGVFIENGGASNGTQLSHWKKIFAANELMNPSTDQRLIISNMTLAYLRATGWYGIQEGAHQDWYYGKDRGCSFFQTCRNTTTEFCTKADKFQCTHDYKSIGYCISDENYHPTCIVAYSTEKHCDVDFTYSTATKSSYETFGSSSACFNPTESDSQEPKCLKSECEGSSAIRVIASDGSSAKCTFDYQEFSLAGDKFKCPQIVDFCSKMLQRCKNDCEKDGNGLCLAGGKCFCFFGESNGRCNSSLALTLSASLSLFVALLLIHN